MISRITINEKHNTRGFSSIVYMDFFFQDFHRIQANDVVDLPSTAGGDTKRV
jgi:hypothetical protein